MSNQYDELFIKFLLNDLNTEEEAFVLNWINLNEQNSQYFEELKKTWNLTAVKKLSDTVNVDDEWLLFKKTVVLKKQEGDQAGGEIIEFEKPATNRTFYRLLVATAIAASVLLLIAMGSGIFSTKQPETQPVARSSKEETKFRSAFFRHQVNTSGKTEKIKLQDGSEVLLYNQSEISYNEPFTNNKRDIVLKGKADFRVAKDKSKPFTVYSGDISTTALGTRFIVTAYEKATNIIVRLYEGKILVKAAYITKNMFQRDFYLLPGDEFIYDKNQLAVRLRKFKANNYSDRDDSGSDSPTGDNPLLPKNSRGSWFMFNNQPVSQVFDQLANMYNVKISYHKKDVTKMYFIGKFNKSDSVERILEEIATLNHLKVFVEGNEYIITK